MQVEGRLRAVRLSMREDDKHVQVTVDLRAGEALRLFEYVQFGHGARVGSRVSLLLLEQDE